MNLTEFIARSAGLQQRLKLNVRESLYAESEVIIKELEKRSPLDSGLFKSNWFIGRPSRAGSTNAYAAVTINNNTIYGAFLDDGATPGGPPWYWPSVNNPLSGGGTSKSGKLIFKNNRVWAGGKSPTGFVSPYGITNEVLMYNNVRQRLMANAIGDAVVESI